MAQRFPLLRSLLTTVLIAVMLLAAFTGATTSLRFALSGLHAPHHEERIGANSIADIRATSGVRPQASDGSAASAAPARFMATRACVSLTERQAPRDWRKLSSGLVPLPLRI